jgi:hypothetical protein
MIRVFVSTILLSFAALATAELVGQPAPASNVAVTLQAEISPSTGADTYRVAWLRNGVAQVIDNIAAADFPADGKVQKTLTGNSGGDLLCVRVSAVNAGGETAQDQSCYTVSLPALPSQPLVVSLLSL